LFCASCGPETVLQIKIKTISRSQLLQNMHNNKELASNDFKEELMDLSCNFLAASR
jgi:hypothetical protein